MRKILITAAIVATVFFIVMAISVSLGYYIAVSAGEVFGTPSFGEYAETSVALGGSLGLILGFISGVLYCECK